MGLLEQAQLKKQELTKQKELEKNSSNAESKGLLEKSKGKKFEKQYEKQKLEETDKKTKEKKSKELLQKKPDKKEENKEKKSFFKKKETKEPEKKIEPPKPKKKIYEVTRKTTDKKEIIEEKEGFGWKGMGIRRIILDKESNEHIYEVDEPVLTDYETEIKKELTRLFKMLADVNIDEIDEEKKAKFLEETLDQIIKDNNIHFVEKENTEQSRFPLSFALKNKDKTNKEEIEITKTWEELEKEADKSKDKIFYSIFQDFLGFGRIDIIMKDEGIEDISCDGHHVPIFIYHKTYDEISTNVWFDDEWKLTSFVVRLAQVCGKQISIYSPIVDGKLPDGSRLQCTLARTVTRGSTFTIRKFKENPLTPIDLIGFESISVDMAAYFWMAIEKGASILFCGGTASGKTTALNALSLFIPSQHKIVSIEDTREVNLPHKNWIAGTTRQGFSASDDKTGKDIDMFDLIRAALRQRPKVVMVGEVRGKEAYSLFQAMSTGHTSYATVHASDIHTLIQRLENPPIALPRALLTSLDVIIFQNAIDIAGKTVRRMTSVTEIVKLDPDTNQLIFMEPFKWVSKTDDRFNSSGSSKILNNIRIQNDWSEEQLEKEIENRKLILNWMFEKNIRDYKEVGKLVNLYTTNPETLLKRAKEEIKK
ncbi:MAG: type II/IV secretion system ATPase subunit [Alphaproteobacteria bacterium]